MTYPANHRQIVADLLAGKFILEQSPLFDTIQSHFEFYKTFFQKSYGQESDGYELKKQANYYFLLSKDTEEKTSRDLILFLALLAYEYHNEQRDLVKELREGVFDVAEIDTMLKASSKYDELLKNTQVEDFERFINTWHHRNLLSFVGNEKRKFRFNAPIHTFLEVAAELSKQYLEGVETTF